MARRERSRRVFLRGTAAATGLTATVAGCLEPENTENNTTNNQTTNQTQQQEQEEDLQDGLTQEEINELNQTIQDYFRIPTYTATIEDETGINPEQEQIQVVFTSDYEVDTEITGTESFSDELQALAFRYESFIEKSEEIDNLEYDLNIVGTGKNGETHQTCVEYEVSEHYAGMGPYEKDPAEWRKRTGLDEYQEEC